MDKRVQGTDRGEGINGRARGHCASTALVLRQESTEPGRKTHVLDGGSSTGHLPQSDESRATTVVA